MKRVSGPLLPHCWPADSGQAPLGQGCCGLSGGHMPNAAPNANQHNSSRHNALLDDRAASGGTHWACVPGHPGHAAALAAQPVAGSLHHWQHALCKRLRALWLLPLACALVSCADDSAQQQQAQSLLSHGVASDIRHNTLMDAAFGTENERIVPGEVYWQTLLPLPKVLPQAAWPPTSAAKPASAGKAGKAAAPASGKPRSVAAWPAVAIGDIENQMMAVRPREAVQLNDEHVALVVESLPLKHLPGQPKSSAQGRGPAVPAAASASTAANVPVMGAVPTHIGVIFFQADVGTDAASAAGKGGQGNKSEMAAEQWRALRFVPHVDVWLAGATLPDVQVYRLGASRYLVTYMQTTCQAGACSRWLKGYLLQPEAMRAVFSTRLASSNAQQWADCPARLGLTDRADDALAASVRQLHAQAGADTGVAASAATSAGTRSAASGKTSVQAANKTPTHSCHAVLGEVHLISRGSADVADVQIRYSGMVSAAPGQLRPIAQAQLFRLQGEQLVQIDGAASPVPAQL